MPRGRQAGKQLTLKFPARWGGARAGAGRKPGPRPNVPHRARPEHAPRHPVHVTLRARLSPLRSQHVFPTVRLAVLRASQRAPEEFRVVAFSVQRDHVHMVVEAMNKRELSKGVRSVMIRVARYVNELLLRRGALWADRWHGRALVSPREVRNALLYVLANFRKHSHHKLRAGLDPYSSAASFDGWRGWHAKSGVPPPFAHPVRWRLDTAPPTSIPPVDEPSAAGDAPSPRDFAARTWLARVGWRKHGLLGLTEAPAP